MKERTEFDSNLARAHSMNFGLWVGILCSLSFLFAVYARGGLLLAQLGNLLGIFAIILAGMFLRKYRELISPLTFGQACRISFLTYFFASLITAVVQFIYFRYLDHGQVAEQMTNLLESPEYQQMLQRLSGQSDVKDIMESATSLLYNPIQMTIQLTWMNLILSIILTPLTALIGITGGKKNK